MATNQVNVSVVRGEVCVNNTRPTRVLEALQQSGVSLALMLPALFGLCPLAHLRAWASLEATLKQEPMSPVLARALMRAQAWEGVLETIRSLAFDPTLGQEALPLSSLAPGMQAMRGGLKTLSACVAGNTSEEPETSFDTTLEHVIEPFLCHLPPLPSLRTLESLDAWWEAVRHSKSGLAMHAVRVHEASLSLGSLGEVSTLPVVGSLEEAPLVALLTAMSCDVESVLKPQYQGTQPLTGALAWWMAQAQSVSLTLNRLIAARWASLLTVLEVLKRDEASHPLLRTQCALFPSGAMAAIPTARGTLLYGGTMREGRPWVLGVISPTEWQFAPHGPVATAMASVLRRVHDPRLVTTLFMGFDACVPVNFIPQS